MLDLLHEQEMIMDIIFGYHLDIIWMSFGCHLERMAYHTCLGALLICQLGILLLLLQCLF